MTLIGMIMLASSIISFKDADKIKSWDAWDDHKSRSVSTNILQKEKICVTWEKLNKMEVPGVKEIGRLQTRTSPEIKSSKWSVGCETMDRDYAEWDSFKDLLPMLGVKHARFFSGWAKTEQEKGKYDFTWLDRHIRECAAMSIKPWICISYGNPVWGSDFRLGMKVKQVTGNKEAFAAWLRYTKALVERYKDTVDEWEIWNEPFNQPEEYALMFYETAKAVREVQPNAKCFVTAITWNGKNPEKSDYAAVLEKLKKENALDLASYFIYHPYDWNPDKSYGWYDKLRTFVKSYNGSYDIIQGEVGCPSQLEYAHALDKVEWTEYSQAKWDLRRAIGDASRAIPSNLFTMIDLRYTFMLQSFGLVRSNLLKEFVYRRPSWYAMRNIYALFDDETLPREYKTFDLGKHKISFNSFSRLGQMLYSFHFCDGRPDSGLEFELVDLPIPGRIEYPVVIELITGKVYEIPEKNIVKDADGQWRVKAVPMWDSPIILCSRTAAPLSRDWKKETPYTIIDSLYRPGQPYNKMKAMPAPDSQDWMKMKTEDFLPCFDKYGQFKWRDWPGKTLRDEDLAAAKADEEKDLAANPGPSDRSKFGGWAAGPRHEATGRFRIHKDGKGKWWFVDPEGFLFWSFGPVRVTPSSGMTPINGDNSTPRTGVALQSRECMFEDLSLSQFFSTRDELLWPFFLARGETKVYDFSSANLFRKYGEDYKRQFAEICHRRLRSWGCNTIANSSDLDICLMDKTPYAERVECQSRHIAGSHGAWWKFRDPWDASFKKGVAEALKAHGREAHDPWCIGFFIDNEINWGAERDLAKWTIQSPADQPAKVAFAEWLLAKYGSFQDVNAKWGSMYADKADFLSSTLLPGEKANNDLHLFSNAVIEEYFKRTREAVKSFDSKLLYLGCRFAGWARIDVVRACARYCDVVSYNIYADEIENWRLPEKIDAPVLIGEFHFGATDRGPFGTGVRQVANQQDRAKKMQRYVDSALANPQIVGVHWHQYSDQATSGRFDGEYLQVGWTDICDRPYPIMRAALRETTSNLYIKRIGE